MESNELSVEEVSPEEAKTKERIIIKFCVPGTEFSSKFLKCYTDLFQWAKGTNIDFHFINAEGSNIHHVRESLLLCDINGHSGQVPFNGEPYHYVLFVDSDQIFTPQDVDKLLIANKDVICGAIKMHDGNYSQGWYNENYYAQTGSTYRIIPEMLDSFDHPFRVTLLGCGFTLIKKGVIERIKFPYFRQVDHPAPRCGYLGEDMSFFTRLIKAGTECYLHPKVKIGHEKMFVI
jgi:hypothetical protein